MCFFVALLTVKGVDLVVGFLWLQVFLIVATLIGEMLFQTVVN